MPKRKQLKRRPEQFEEIKGIGPKRAERLRQEVGPYSEFKNNAKHAKKNKIARAVSGNRRNLPGFAQNAIKASSSVTNEAIEAVDSSLINERQVDKRSARTRSKTSMREKNERADRSGLGFETMENDPSKLDLAAERFTSAFDDPYEPNAREIGDATQQRKDPDDRATFQPVIGAATSRTVFGSRDPGEQFRQELEQTAKQTDRPTASPGEMADAFIDYVDQEVGLAKRSAGSGFFTTSPTQPTDIGREADGEFARPESSPDIAPAPIDRDRKTGRFGLDPFDVPFGKGTGDTAENLFGSDR